MHLLKAEHRISLADAITLATAAARVAPWATSDHHEFDPQEQQAAARFIWTRCVIPLPQRTCKTHLNSVCSTMPLVFEKDGFKFAFYSNDHRPIHVHVRKGDGEAIFDVEDSIQLRESVGLKIRELARAQELAEEHRDLIIQKWHEHLA